MGRAPGELLSARPPGIAESVPLAPLTTLGVGGRARYLARCGDFSRLVQVLDWAHIEQLEIFILGGGSNLLVADAGFPGLCVQLTGDGIASAPRGEQATVRAAAGVDWDALVARTVAAGLGGIECLSGIPGRVGAAPIQNIGAYGQEVAQTVSAVEVVDLESGERQQLAAADCGFGYRSSHFKAAWRGRYAVTRVDFRLTPGALGTVRYPDLRQHLAADGAEPSLAAVRRAVLAVRRSKSMVIDPEDPNRASAGSFFVNPVVPAAQAEEVRTVAARLGRQNLPVYPVAGGAGDVVKLSAGWLIEAAGLRRGDRLGRAGISTRHALALVNLGGASAREILTLAARVRARVRRTFGVELRPEPVFLGFSEDPEQVLDSLAKEM